MAAATASTTSKQDPYFGGPPDPRDRHRPEYVPLRARRDNRIVNDKSTGQTALRPTGWRQRAWASVHARRRARAYDRRAHGADRGQRLRREVVRLDHAVVSAEDVDRSVPREERLGAGDIEP